MDITDGGKDEHRAETKKDVNVRHLLTFYVFTFYPFASVANLWVGTLLFSFSASSASPR